MIDHNHKCIFIHIPKCAGTTITWTLMNKIPTAWNGKYWEQHATLKQTDPEEKYKNYFKFSFIRNPFDRLVSAYTWVAQVEKIDSPIKKFKDFIYKKNIWEKLLNPNKKHNKYCQILPMTYFLDGDMDFIGKVENIKEDWNYVMNKLEINTLIDFVNLRKTNHKNYKDYYTDELIEYVKKHYADDIRLGNYEY